MQKACGFCLLALGVILIIVSAVLIVVPNQMIKESLPLVKDSKVFESWKEPGKIPVTMEFYFFDIKNNLHTQASNESTETPIEHGGKPIVEEKGPYVYRETRVRSNITFNDDQTELGFSERTRFEFDAEASNGKESDLIHGINMPMLTVYGLISKMDNNNDMKPWIINIFNDMVKTFKLEVVQRKTVGEWLWGANCTILEQLMENKLVLPDDMREKATTTQFGYMMDNNATSQYVIGTGYEDLRDVAQIKKYNGKAELDYWGSCYSNQIKGTDGTIFHPNVNSKETLFMFSADICRSIYATFEREQAIKGINTLVFTPPSDVFASPDENKKNEGFCEPKPCLGSGLLRVTNCRHDAPLVISQPHLCDADENVTKSVEGIHPDPSKHKTRLYVEPNLGVMVKAHKRLQFNALLLAEKEFDLTKNMIKDQILPLFWVQEGFTGDDEFASMLSSNVGMIAFFTKYGTTIFGLLLAAGLLTLIAFFGVILKSKSDTTFGPTVKMSSLKNANGNTNIGYSRT